MSARSPLKVDSPCEYRPDGEGLQRWRPAIVQAFERDHQVLVRPTAGDRTPLLLPRARVRGLSPSQIAGIRWGVCRIVQGAERRRARSGGPARSDFPISYKGSAGPPPQIVARLGALGKPVPKGIPRIVDRRYLAWIRTRPCICSEGCRRKPQAHHAGPHAYGVRSHDLWALPVCPRAHLVFLHDQGHLPHLSPEETRRLLLAQVIQHLLIYFAPVVQPSATHWYHRASIVDRFDDDEQLPVLQLILDQLTLHLYQLRQQGVLHAR